MATLESSFNNEQVKVIPGGFKVTASELNDDRIIKIARLSTEMACDILVKRSGTGLTVIITI